MRLMTALLLGAALNAVAGVASALGPSWPLAYRDESTNTFRWDKRTRTLIESKTHRPFATELEDALGGPPGPVIVRQDRYFAASACVPHDCLRKGFFWLDAQGGWALGAMFRGSYPANDGALELDSTTIAGEVPESARLALIAWLEEVKARPTSVEFTDASGTKRSLAVASFVPPQRFVPQSGGPSFDCARASTSIETLICGDAALSAQDLKLSEHYKDMLVGAPTLPMRRQLTAYQQLWLKRRDANCEQAGSPKECVAKAYRAQADLLLNWIPLPDEPQDLSALARTWFRSGSIVHRGQEYDVYRQPDANGRTASFNVGLKAHQIAAVDSCAVLVDLPVGTGHGNHSFGGVCSQPAKAAKQTVLVCDDDMVGHFGFRVVGARKVSIETLARFVADECFGG